MVKWFGKQKRPGGSEKTSAETEKFLREFVTSRRGVEGFVEPETAVTPVTLLLVAHDGEWTRRKVGSILWAHEFCNQLGIGSYDAGLVGIPQRMRDYNKKQRG